MVSTIQPTRRKQSSLGSIFRALAVIVVILWSSRSANPPLRMSILRSSTEGNCLLMTNLSMSLLTSLLYALPCQGVRRTRAPGEDTIPSEILAQLPHPSLLALLELFNRVWANGVLPVSWKNSIVVPILKPQKPAHEGSSYRPIALTSV